MLTMIFAVLEGADAVGKHTQSGRLRDRLISLGIDVQLYSFPRYETQFGQALLNHLKRRSALIDIQKLMAEGERLAQTRALPHQARQNLDPAHGSLSKITHEDDPLAFQALMLMDKADAAPGIVRALKKGQAIVADRWWHSALAYGTSDGLDDSMLVRIHETFPVANVHVLLDLDPKIAAERRGKPRDRYEEDRAKMERVSERYRLLWQRHAGEDEYAIVDASMGADNVEAAIWSHVSRAIDKAHKRERDSAKILIRPRRASPPSFVTWS